jgi:hypothetical protein
MFLKLIGSDWKVLSGRISDDYKFRMMCKEVSVMYFKILSQH